MYNINFGLFRIVFSLTYIIFLFNLIYYIYDINTLFNIYNNVFISTILQVFFMTFILIGFKYHIFKFFVFFNHIFLAYHLDLYRIYSPISVEFETLILFLFLFINFNSSFSIDRKKYIIYNNNKDLLYITFIIGVFYLNAGLWKVFDSLWIHNHSNFLTYFFFSEPFIIQNTIISNFILNNNFIQSFISFITIFYQLSFIFLIFIIKNPIIKNIYLIIGFFINFLIMFVLQVTYTSFVFLLFYILLFDKKYTIYFLNYFKKILNFKFQNYKTNLIYTNFLDNYKFIVFKSYFFIILILTLIIPFSIFLTKLNIFSIQTLQQINKYHFSFSSQINLYTHLYREVGVFTSYKHIFKNINNLQKNFTIYDKNDIFENKKIEIFYDCNHNLIKFNNIKDNILFQASSYNVEIMKNLRIIQPFIEFFINEPNLDISKKIIKNYLNYINFNNLSEEELNNLTLFLKNKLINYNNICYFREIDLDYRKIKNLKTLDILIEDFTKNNSQNHNIFFK